MSKAKGKKKKMRNRNGVTNNNTPCILSERLNTRVLGGHDCRLPDVPLKRFFFVVEKWRLISFFKIFLGTD